MGIRSQCVCASFIPVMYTDMHSVLFQFAFNQWRFMVIHGLCCWSQSNPGSGPRRLTSDRVVNYLLRRGSKITQRVTNSQLSSSRVSQQQTALQPNQERLTLFVAWVNLSTPTWLFWKAFTHDSIFGKRKKKISSVNPGGQWKRVWSSKSSERWRIQRREHEKNRSMESLVSCGQKLDISEEEWID